MNASRGYNNQKILTLTGQDFLIYDLTVFCFEKDMLAFLSLKNKKNQVRNNENAIKKVPGRKIINRLKKYLTLVKTSLRIYS
jgi:hypothetical protein